MTTPAHLKYKTLYSKLRQWNDTSSVRTTPRRLLTMEIPAKLYFPPELVPTVQHPVIQNLGPQVIREILINRLYQYLDFTVILEQEAVNPSLLNIARRKIGVELPYVMVFDANKIYVDEGYHAYFSEDLKRQIMAETGVPGVPFSTPRFLRRLREIEAGVAEEFRDLTSLFFTIVSETLISALLSQIPTDERVVGAVREVVRDHAQDEAHHHAYFATLLTLIWPELTANQKSTIGPLIPLFILAFLEPDYPAMRRVLTQYDLEPEEIQRVIDESYPEEQVQSGIREGAKATLSHFRQIGVLEEPEIAEAFQNCGLVE